MLKNKTTKILGLSTAFMILFVIWNWLRYRASYNLIEELPPISKPLLSISFVFILISVCIKAYTLFLQSPEPEQKPEEVEPKEEEPKKQGFFRKFYESLKTLRIVLIQTINRYNEIGSERLLANSAFQEIVKAGGVYDFLLSHLFPLIAAKANINDIFIFNKIFNIFVFQTAAISANNNRGIT